MNEYENIETVETVEIDNQESSVDVLETDDSVLSDSTGIESDMVQDAEAVTEESSTESVPSGESETNVYVMDSDGNFIPFTVSDSDASPEQAEIQNLSANDFEPYFSEINYRLDTQVQNLSLDELEPYFLAINYRLDTIIFLLLSFWVIKRIKIAVAKMTGRSLDGRKDVLDR